MHCLETMKRLNKEAEKREVDQCVRESAKVYFSRFAFRRKMVKMVCYECGASFEKASEVVRSGNAHCPWCGSVDVDLN